jgi:hypothetical protein
MIGRLIFSLLLALMLAALSPAQEDTSILDSSDLALLDGEGSVSEETTGGQETVDEAKEMDQLIVAIEDSSGSSETIQNSETSETVQSSEGTGQSTQGSEDGSGSGSGSSGTSTVVDVSPVSEPVVEVNPVSGPVEEAKDIDQMIQVLNEGTNQSTGISGEESKTAVLEADEKLDASNQTESVDRLIKRLADAGINGSSDIVQDVKPINQTETEVRQSMQVSGDGSPSPIVGITSPAPIQGITESMNKNIQSLVNSGNNIGTKAAQPSVLIDDGESVAQLVQAIEEKQAEIIVEDNDVTSGQSFEIIEEGDSLDRMIQSLENSNSSSA